MPTLLQAVLLPAGVFCVAGAGRLVRLAARPADVGSRRRPGGAALGRVAGAVLDRLNAVAAGISWLRRSGDDATVRRRYLLAPGAWPWRLARPALPPGRRSRDPAAVLAGLRFGGLAAGTLTGVLILCWAGRPAIPILPALLAGGTAIVDLATATAAARAERALILELPHALDLLAAGLAAGMSLEVAILWCAHQSGPPSNAVFARVGTRLASGEPPAVALRAEADLSGVGLLVAIAGVVGRCRRQGLPAAPAIVAISDGARAKARTALLDRSGRSGPLATVVVAVLIAPACVAALVIALAGGFLSGGGFEVAALGTRHL